MFFQYCKIFYGSPEYYLKESRERRAKLPNIHKTLKKPSKPKGIL